MPPTSRVIRLNTIDAVVGRRFGRPRRNRFTVGHRRDRRSTGRLRRRVPLGRFGHVVHVVHPARLRVAFLPTSWEFVLQDLVVVVVVRPADIPGGANDGQRSATGGAIARHERHDDLALDRVRVVVGSFAQVEPLVWNEAEREKNAVSHLIFLNFRSYVSHLIQFIQLLNIKQTLTTVMNTYAKFT